MGGEGARTRSLENVPRKSRCCVPNESRAGHENARLAFIPRHPLLGNVRASRVAIGALANRRERCEALNAGYHWDISRRGAANGTRSACAPRKIACVNPAIVT